MNNKRDTASALAGILKAKRQPESPQMPDPAPEPEAVEDHIDPPAPATAVPNTPPPSPAPIVPPAIEEKPQQVPGRTGKFRDPNYSQHSIYLKKGTHKRVKRLLEDEDTGQDFSMLVQELLEQWLRSHT